MKIQTYPGNPVSMIQFVAEAQGFYKANCLTRFNNEWVNIATGPAALSASVTGSVEFVPSSPDNLIVARGQGLDIRIVASLTSRNILAFVVGTGTPLPHLSEGYPAVMKDLVGKKIAVPGLGSAYFFAQANFTAAGLDPKSAEYVSIATPDATLAALANHTVDAAEVFGATQDIAEARGIARIVADLRKPGVGSPTVQALNGANLVWAVQNSFIAQKPDILRRFVKANNETVAWILNRANRSALYKLSEGFMPLPTDVPNAQQLREKIVDTFADMVTSDPISEPVFSAWNSWTVSTGATTKTVPYGDLVWSGRP